MKNIGTGILAFLAFSVCCGGPIILSSLSLGTLGWITNDVMLVSVAVAIGSTFVIIWVRNRRRHHPREEMSSGDEDKGIIESKGGWKEEC